MRLLIIGFSLLSMACANQVKSERHGLIYTYGSSITAGLAHPNYSENVADELNMNIVQAAKGGTSLFDQNSVGDRTQYDLIMNGAWIPGSTIIWDTGINDAILHGSDAGYLARYTQGVQDILNKFHENHMKVYVTTPVHNCNEPRFGTNANEDLYAQIARNLVSQLNDSNIKIIDFSQNFNPTYNPVLPYDQQFTTNTGTTLDCLHPNAYGYQLMAIYMLGEMK